MRQSGKLILSLAGLTVATPVECKSEKRKEKKGNLIRPSQLPLYENPEDLYSFEYIGKEKSKIEEGVAVARKELQSAYGATSGIRDNVQHYYETGKAHTLTSWSYVRDEENVSAKIGVISAGGLLALLIGGRRKGIIKKLFYTSLGVGGVASLVYPKESKKISQELFNNAGDYSVIAYNFIAGVKPQGENQTPSKSPQESQKPKNIPPKTEVSMNIGSSVDSFQSLARQAKVWYEKLRYIFKRSKTEDVNEEKDISEMDKKFDQEGSEDNDLQDFSDSQNTEENFESESVDVFSYVPKFSKTENFTLERDQNFSVMKSPSVKESLPKENDKEVIVKENKKDVIVKIKPLPSTTPPPIKGDIGQSNPEDKDMYTTRS
ncbi:MICOS complex subunit Mic27 [Armadillidium vulgare]|nr:MICOS complex subunit Mic27 [Armadillidium vulgare]